MTFIGATGAIFRGCAQAKQVSYQWGGPRGPEATQISPLSGLEEIWVKINTERYLMMQVGMRVACKRD